MWVKASIRNTLTQYAIRNVGQSLNTQYAIRITHNALRNAGQSPNTQYAIRNTQYAVRNAHPCANNQIAIRNTQYAIRNTRPAANTQCAIRNTHQGGSEWVRQHAIRNTQYAMRVKTGRLRLLQYAIRNTQYANPVKPHCVIRKMLPQYAIAQYAAYGVPHISHESGITFGTSSPTATQHIPQQLRAVPVHGHGSANVATGSDVKPERENAARSQHSAHAKA
jgi:hypothetical protein